MTAIRTWVCGIVGWGALGASATAAPLSWFGSQDSLNAWYANQINSAGNIYAPKQSDTVSNLPAHWFYQSDGNSTSWNATQESATISVGGFGESASLGIPATSVAPMSLPSQTETPARETQAAASILAADTARAHAFLNFGTGEYAEASILTVGSPSPWYNSSAVTTAFGGVPNEGQRADFVRSVIANVQHTFRISGLDLNLTDDPNTSAPHTLSVVSGASYGGNPDAVGITNVGSSGFSFIDKLAYASDADELAWAVAHNISHELMHALGVATHPDETGDYLDAAVANWSTLVDPDTKFSPAAVALMKSATDGPGLGTLGLLELLAESDHPIEALDVSGAQFLETPVPEPSTIAIWTLTGLFAGLTIRRRIARAETG